MLPTLIAIVMGLTVFYLTLWLLRFLARSTSPPQLMLRLMASFSFIMWNLIDKLPGVVAEIVTYLLALIALLNALMIVLYLPRILEWWYRKNNNNNSSVAEFEAEDCSSSHGLTPLY